MPVHTDGVDFKVLEPGGAGHRPVRRHLGGVRSGGGAPGGGWRPLTMLGRRRGRGGPSVRRCCSCWCPRSWWSRLSGWGELRGRDPRVDDPMVAGRSRAGAAWSSWRACSSSVPLISPRMPPSSPDSPPPNGLWSSASPGGKHPRPPSAAPRGRVSRLGLLGSALDGRWKKSASSRPPSLHRLGRNLLPGGNEPMRQRTAGLSSLPQVRSQSRRRPDARGRAGR